MLAKITVLKNIKRKFTASISTKQLFHGSSNSRTGSNITPRPTVTNVAQTITYHSQLNFLFTALKVLTKEREDFFLKSKKNTRKLTTKPTPNQSKFMT